MLGFLADKPPVLQALFGTLFTWFLTALGAGVVLFFKKLNKKLLDAMLGFAAGVMIAASFFSLIGPAIEMTQTTGQTSWLVAAIGFALGCAFLFLADKLLPHVHAFGKEGHTEGIKTHWKKSILLVGAITLHNIPEGLAVGVAAVVKDVISPVAGIVAVGALARPVAVDAVATAAIVQPGMVKMHVSPAVNRVAVRALPWIVPGFGCVA